MKRIEGVWSGYKNYENYRSMNLLIEGRRAVLAIFTENEAVSGIGGSPGKFTRYGLSIADGRNVINLLATAPQNVDIKLNCEIESILTSIKFIN